MRAYRRNTDGTLTTIEITGTPAEPCDGLGYPLTDCGATVTLEGWPDDSARVYKTDGGVEVLVPIRHLLETEQLHSEIDGQGQLSHYAPHACDSVTTADGHGAYCPICGTTTA